MKKAVTFSIFLTVLLFVELTSRAAEQPQITTVRLEDTNLVVEATVPAGIIKVTLQSRDRAEGSSWVPRAVARLDGAGGSLTFRVGMSAKFELLRVRADETDPLPASFYTGTNNFTGEIGASTPTVPNDMGGAGGAPEGDKSRTVVESDIWKVEGNTIYFFNTYRGLQVIDISTPAAPVIKSSFDIPAVGEQMYIHRDHAVLLARNGCSWWGNDSESRIVVVNVGGSVLSLSASLPVPGWIQESRMVGEVLYVASQTYKRATNSETWEWGTVVTSYDLSNPATPAARGTLWFPGYGNTIAATDEYLFVATTLENNWYQSVLNLIDITSPTGEMTAKGTVRPNGRIPDKFKIHQNGDTLSVISHGQNSSNQWISILQTYSIANPSEPVRLASIELAPNEQLHATRFDGNRVYVVTFFRIDPLWIIDLTDPARPQILSELEVPGWSTYIHPMGDRLVAVGIETTNGWRTTISLFDVADPAKPALLDREFLGEGYSWSEANNDEKAFNVLEGAGLILVPYSGNVNNGYVNQVQLIDLARDSLTKRGVINHRLQPRRATLQNEHVFSLSSRELISVNASNRDQPEVKANLALSWSVDDVLLAGDHIIQVEASQYYWWSPAEISPRLLVSAKETPNVVKTALELKRPWPIAGVTLKNGFIYVAQAESTGWWVASDSTTGETNRTNFVMTVVDARNLPVLHETAEIAVPNETLGYVQLEALWPEEDLLVWSTGSGGWSGWWWWGGGLEGDVGIGAPVTRQAMMPIWWGGSYGRLLAFQIPAPGQAQFASSLDLTGTNNWWNFSGAIAVDGALVYLSHQASEYREDLVPPGSRATVTYDPATGTYKTNEPPKGMWISRHYLDVVDYTDPANPARRAPVNIPGVLKDVSHEGAVVYTVYYHYDNNFVSDYGEWVDALSYDGVEAHLLGSLKLPTEWPRPYDLSNGQLYLGKPNSTNTPAWLEHWALDGSGKFALKAQAQLTRAAQSISVVGDLVAVSTDNEMLIYPAAGIGIPKPVGAKPFSSCYYADLQKGKGSLLEGLWLPLRDYGVMHVPVTLR